MTAGLFYVYTEPGSVDEAEFHDWYDHEHGPARLTVPGVGRAYRYRALDEEKPPWLALYELDSPDVVDSPEYKALSANASDRDRSVAAGLATLDRRVYEQVSEDGSPAGLPTPVILAVAMSVPEESEDDLAAWYTEEHIPMLLEVPGWRRNPQVPARPQPGRTRTRFAVRARAGGPRGPRGPPLPGGGQHALARPGGGLCAAAGTTGVRLAQRDRRLTWHPAATPNRTAIAADPHYDLYCGHRSLRSSGTPVPAGRIVSHCTNRAYREVPGAYRRLRSNVGGWRSAA